MLKKRKKYTKKVKVNNEKKIVYPLQTYVKFWKRKKAVFDVYKTTTRLNHYVNTLQRQLIGEDS